MLFVSPEFLWLFAPIALIGFFLIARLGGSFAAQLWLVAISILFYAFWRVEYVLLLMSSVGINYLLGIWLAKLPAGQRKKIILGAGIAINLGLLGFFKYAYFISENFNSLFNSNISVGSIVLPLAISFFTFQQIAYLVDAYRQEVREFNFIRYCLFVVFFPQLIAGPIVHHKEVIPQFARKETFRPKARNLIVGGTFFLIGMAKKILLADSLATIADPVFAAADAGATPLMAEAWSAALAYTFQLYFDFSGYSDMALGLARMLGVRLPVNFFSPYKATNIIDFWRRWHMTLSRFLRDYLYFPLGGNRKGRPRRYSNLMVTMLLGGLWHGAGWSFVFWGGLHGLFLVINHAWRRLVRTSASKGIVLPPLLARSLSVGLGGGLTFAALVFSWVFFRAESFAGATRITSAMVGIGENIPGGDFQHSLTWILPLALAVFVLPNSIQITDRLGTALEGGLGRHRFFILGILSAALFVLAAMATSDPANDFIYFNF